MSSNAPSQSNPADDQAYALMQSALALVPQGEWKQAAEALVQAADLHAQAGRAYDEARCLQLAATLLRSQGDPAGSQALIERANVAAPPDPTLAASIYSEQAESAFASGRYEFAEESWTHAITSSEEAQFGADKLSALFRGRAATRLALGQVQSASTDFDQAHDLLAAATDTHGTETARFVRTEQADLLMRYGYVEEARTAILSVEADLGTNPAGAHLAAELGVMRARLARAVGQNDAAAGYALRAREAALEAVAPVSYFAASVELADALQSQDDRAGAYGTLATAWATLSDVLGKDAARSWVEPCLLGYRTRWGDQAFRQAKADYEAKRRTETQRSL